MLKRPIRRRISSLGRNFDSDVSYLEALLDADVGAVMRFARLQGLSDYRRSVAPKVSYAAKVQGTMREDCGPCTHVGPRGPAAARDPPPLGFRITRLRRRRNSGGLRRVKRWMRSRPTPAKYGNRRPTPPAAVKATEWMLVSQALTQASIGDPMAPWRRALHFRSIAWSNSPTLQPSAPGRRLRRIGTYRCSSCGRMKHCNRACHGTSLPSSCIRNSFHR